MTLADFRIVYDTINYDNKDGIDFQKFCLINPDKNADIFKNIEDIKVNKELVEEMRNERE